MKSVKMISAVLFPLVALCAAAGDLTGVMFGRYAETEAAADAEVAALRKAGKPLSFASRDKHFGLRNRAITPLLAARDCKWVLGKYEELKALCEGAIAGDPKMPAADVYELKLSAALAPLKGEVSAIADQIAKLEPALAKGVAPKDRVTVLYNCGCVANAANNENLVRGLALYLERVSPTPQRRLYTVLHTTHAVTGPDSWSQLGFVPERQELSRDYGGGREFFVTDVTTGDRGAAGAGELKTRPTMSVVCDDWGIHFRFDDPDEKAREIEMGLVSAGSYEAYLGPGANTPYFCFLLYPNGKPMTIMNTLYDHAGFRQVDANDVSQVRNLNVFSDKCVSTFVSFSWDAWGDRIPTDGFRWDFEIVRWGRAGSAAWNGLKSVHGRSTWGELSFALPKAARLSILRRQVIRAKGHYLAECVSTARKTGVVDHWRDADLGDPAFYEACLAPLVKELDGYVAEVKADMSDETVLKLAEKAMPKWRDIVYVVADLRADYLSRQLREKASKCGEPQISVFAKFIRQVAAERGVTKAKAAEMLYDLGVRGFDAGPDETDLAELAATKLKPINFYYFPDWFNRKDDSADKTTPAQCLALAKKFGIPRIMVVPPDFTGGKDNPKEFGKILGFMRKFVADAKKKGITVTVEDFGGTANCCSYAKYLKAFLTEIPDIRFALDSGNFYYAGRGEDILEMMAFAKGRIAHVHLKDQTKENNRVYATMGLGAVPNEKVVKAVSAAGYDGWYTLENPVGDTYSDTVRQAALLKDWLK